MPGAFVSQSGHFSESRLRPTKAIASNSTVGATVGLALLGVCAVCALGQQKPGTLPNPPAEAPSISSVFPPGGQRGTVAELEVRGRELADSLGVLLTFPARATILPDKKEPTTHCLVRLEIPKDAPIGVHLFRLVTRRGVSNPLPFCVDDLPEVRSTLDHRTPAQAQKVPLPCGVSGRVDAEASYYYRFSLQSGQRICLEVVSWRMGSPLDPVLVLHDSSGRQVAFSDDAPGLNRDSRIVFTAKQAGDYTLQLRDVRYQGGPNFVYRLRIGDFPCATTAYPFVVQRGKKPFVGFAGPLLDGVSPMALPVASAPHVLAVLATPQRPNGPPGWPVVVGISDLDEITESEPNDAPEKAQALAIPCAVHGRFDKPGDRDYFRLAVKKGQRLVVEAQSWEYGSPSAVYLVLQDAQGKQLANSNPMQDPPRIEHNVAADGELILAVEHLHYAGGPEETYRVVVQWAEPSFRVEALQDRVDVPAGGVGMCFLRVVRSGWNAPVRVRVESPSSVQGETLLSGEQGVGLLQLTAPQNTQPGAWPLQLVAVSKSDGREIIAPVTGSEWLAGLFHSPLPRHLLSAQAVAVTEPPPFTLEVQYNPARLVRGQTGLEAIVQVSRQGGWNEEVQITAVAPPPAPNQPVILAAAASGKIPPGQQQTKLALKLPKNLPLGPLPLAIVGQAKHAGRSYQIFARGNPPEVVAAK